jgi:prepilin-type N-terminal cleavage/methylation domain-containing protein
MRPGRQAGQAGITLIEMLVVMAVLALLAGALTVGFTRLPETALRREGTRVAAVLRTAYDRGTDSGAHHRVVIDFAEGTFALERCEGKVQVRKVRDLQEEVERQRIEAEKQALVAGLQTADQLLSTIVSEAGQKVGGVAGLGGAGCEPVRGAMGGKQRLGGRPQVSFSRVFVAHLEQPAEDGQVTVNFFPLGTAERAMIELEADVQHHFSIVVHPLSGRLELMQGQWRDVEEHLTRDAEGEQI